MLNDKAQFFKAEMYIFARKSIIFEYLGALEGHFSAPTGEGIVYGEGIHIIYFYTLLYT